MPRTLEQPFALKITSAGFLTFWCLLAAFPIFWITVMSIKEPVEAFSSNPLEVILGPFTRDQGKGLSLLDMILGGIILYFTVKLVIDWLPKKVRRHSPWEQEWLGWMIGTLFFGIAAFFLFFFILPNLMVSLNLWIGTLGKPLLGLTMEHYHAVWVKNEFYQNFINSLIVTAGVVAISLSIGTLAGYGLARSRTNLAFGILIVALIFRALPHSVLVAGYLPVFMHSREILEPIFGSSAPTLYGQPWAVIAVLVSINQPFTIWMLRSFFQNIPSELDEAARVDGCNHFQAFRMAIMPVMWPGVITTGLFSFLLAYNDYLVTSLLLDAQNQTMVPAISGYFNRETTTTDQVEAVAAAVSISAPLLLLVLVFQKQIVSGLVQGAVKG